MIETYNNRALLVDLYELTMAAAYFEHRVESRGTFEMFVRQLPPERSYLVAAGLDSALGFLENLHYNDEDIRFLREQSAFRTVSDGFFDYLRSFRFTGEVRAVPEGTLIFANEPILQLSGPILEAQIVETYLLSVINFETLVASKAARIVTSAAGRPVWEFGTRRAQGPQAGVRAARAAYVGGCAGTSNVLAGYLYGVPLAGTAAHSWTQAFPSEREAFDALVDTFPDSAILLIDTYDLLQGAETAATLGRKIRGVRIDSGDLDGCSRRVRAILNKHGLEDAIIFASGDLNEFKIQELVRQGAPIDGFGVGTDLVTSRDLPALGIIYKLVEIDRGGDIEHKTKFSQNKAHWPGRKQVFRFSRRTPDGREQFHHDLVARAEESYADAAPLLELVMKDGRRVGPRPGVQEMRERAVSNLERFPKRYQSLEDGEHYPVAVSPALERLLEEVRERYTTPEAARNGRVPADPAMAETPVFLDVDTQFDFMDPAGALYVPGAETLVPNLMRLIDYARENRITVISSADAHPPDDPSFAQWPPHCVIGTPGQRRISATELPGRIVIPNRPGALQEALDAASIAERSNLSPGPVLGNGGNREQIGAPLAIEIEKQAYSVAENPNLDTLLAELGPCRFVVFGVATEYCVCASVLALRKLELPVDLVVDAIKPITEEGGRAAIEEMMAVGARAVTTEDVLSGVNLPKVMAS